MSAAGRKPSGSLVPNGLRAVDLNGNLHISYQPQCVSTG
jgi:hypothetical protein